MTTTKQTNDDDPIIPHADPTTGPKKCQAWIEGIYTAFACAPYAPDPSPEPRPDTPAWTCLLRGAFNASDQPNKPGELYSMLTQLRLDGAYIEWARPTPDQTALWARQGGPPAAWMRHAEWLRTLPVRHSSLDPTVGDPFEHPSAYPIWLHEQMRYNHPGRAVIRLPDTCGDRDAIRSQLAEHANVLTPLMDGIMPQATTAPKPRAKPRPQSTKGSPS